MFYLHPNISYIPLLDYLFPSPSLLLSFPEDTLVRSSRQNSLIMELSSSHYTYSSLWCSRAQLPDDLQQTKMSRLGNNILLYFPMLWVA